MRNSQGGGGMLRPNVSHCITENEVHYNPHTFADEYLTFVALENTTFTFMPRNNNVVSYSVDNGNSWTQGNTVEVNAGDKVMWKAQLPSTNYNGNGKFASTGTFNIQGNAMSLVFGDDFRGQTDLSGKISIFDEMFSGNSSIVSAENLVLPATTLESRCYSEMFRDCRSLTVAPKLPATTLATDCYGTMFYGCTSLTTAPELPATTLASQCYYSMFRGCTSLTTTPELPATTLASNCYKEMFYGCTGLVAPPSRLGTETAYRCCEYMFYGCTSLTTAPELPATILAGECYENMFGGCTSLNYIKCLATDISASRCTDNWMTGVAENGTFTKAASMSSWLTGVFGIPSGWTVQDA